MNYIIIACIFMACKNPFNQKDPPKFLTEILSKTMAAFTTGIGDGRYSSCIGYDATRKPYKLHTDFTLLNWKESKK